MCNLQQWQLMQAVALDKHYLEMRWCGASVLEK